MKIVITWKGVWVKGPNGPFVARTGDVVEVSEDAAKELIGMKRGRLFDPAIDSLPPPTIEPEPEPASEPEPEAEAHEEATQPPTPSAGGRGKGKKTKGV